MMKFSRLGLVYPSEPSLDTKLNVCGVRVMLEQEGFFYQDAPPGESPDEILSNIDVIIAIDHGQFSTSDQRRFLHLASKIPLIWVGIPPASASDDLMKLLALPSIGVEETRGLRLLKLGSHPLTRDLSWPEERRCKVKHVEHLMTRGMRRGREVQEVAGIYLLDGFKLGSAIYAISGPPRRVVFGFPLGKLFVLNTSRHSDLRTDLDVMDYPLYTTVDILRIILRNSIAWVNPDVIILRRYYWRPSDGILPKGHFCLNHDLCGFSEEGRQFIIETCREHGIQTTFFDFPPFRLTGESAGGHDVGLHVPDSTPKSDILRHKKALEEIQGREITGWRRHGPSEPSSYPRIWRDMAQAGFRWSTALAVQTNPWMILSEGTATGNRLPYRPIDVEKGEEIGLLELPTFDSQDAERLSNFSYGGRLDWKAFVKNVTRRFDFAERHNLATGYLIHGWTAGVKVEDGRAYGALDCQRMMRLVLGMTRERSFAITSHQELYDWWTFRSKVECSYSDNGAKLRFPSLNYPIALEMISQTSPPRLIRLNGRAVTPVVWRDRMFVIVDPRELRDEVEVSVE